MLLPCLLSLLRWALPYVESNPKDQEGFFQSSKTLEFHFQMRCIGVAGPSLPL